MRKFSAIVYVSVGLATVFVLAGADRCHAGPPSYALVTQFSSLARRMIADPVRPRIYATLRDENSVLIISTDTLSTQKIAIGSSPVGLTISPDGKRLYVANSGSTTGAIGVLDLATLQVLNPISAPAQPYDVAAGLNGVLYVSANVAYGTGFASLMRIDTTTYKATRFGNGTEDASWFQMSPDRKTLFVSTVGGGDIAAYDVSTATPTFVQRGDSGDNIEDLKLSHDGSFIAAPAGGGNRTGYNIHIVPASNLHGVEGSLPTAAYPGPIAFSPDDTVAYEAPQSQGLIRVFDLSSFTETADIPVSGGTNVDFVDIVTDHAGKYLFAAATTYDASATGVISVYNISSTANTSYPLNISTRAHVETGENVLIGGFIIRGGASKRVLVRALGPSLKAQGIADAINDPQLALNTPMHTSLINNDWGESQGAEIAATHLQPSDPRESAIIATLPPGNYTAEVNDIAGNAGVALVELYDLDQSPAASEMANISTRSNVLAGDDVMIAGFILGARQASATVVVRAIGPSLAAEGVANPLADPMLELRNANGGLIKTNDDWKSDQQSAIAKTGLAPANDVESAILATLAPGNYTAIIRGKNDSTGVALAEVYHLQQ